MVPPFVSLLPLAVTFASLAAVGPVRIRAVRRKAARARAAYEAPGVVYDPDPVGSRSAPSEWRAPEPHPVEAGSVAL